MRVTRETRGFGRPPGHGAVVALCGAADEDEVVLRHLRVPHLLWERVGAPGVALVLGKSFNQAHFIPGGAAS